MSFYSIWKPIFGAERVSWYLLWFLCGLVEQFHNVSWAFHAFVAGVSLSSLAFALGAPPSARILHSRGWPVGGASCLAHLREDLHVKIPTQIPRYPGIFGHLCNFSNMFQSYVFPQQRKLGVFSHSKGSGASRSSQIRTAQGWEPGSQEGFPFPRESLGAAKSARLKVRNRSQEEVPKQGSRNRFPSKVPKQGSQEEVPKQGSQARLPGTDSQAMVPSKRFPSRLPRKRGYQEEGFQEEVPRQGSQEVPSKVPRNRFPSKGSPGKDSQQEVPKQGFPGRVSQAQGSQEEVPKQGSQGQVCKQASQEQVPKQRFE